MKWGDSKTVKFIKLYEMHPCLWDTSSPHYTIRSKREMALNAILTKMNIPNFTQAACKSKIKNIRSQYCHERKRVRLSMKAGGKVYKPTLAWFDVLDKFLRPVVVQRARALVTQKALAHNDPVENLETDVLDLEFVDSKKTKEDVPDDKQILKTEDLDITDDEPEILYGEQAVETSGSSCQSPCGSPSNNLFPNQRDVDTRDRSTEQEDKRAESESIKILTAIKKLEQSVMRNTAVTRTNEFDVFGQSVAAQLNSMSIEDALQLQMEIQRLISTKRINILNRR